MIHKITLLTASVLLAIMACLTPRAFAQTFEATHASTLILAGGGTDPVKTLTISVAALSGATSITLPGANASGALVNDGHGTFSWSPIGVAAGTVGQFLVTLAGPTVAWQGLLINSTDFSGDGATTKLAIANTAGNDIITALNNGTPTAPIDVAAGGTGAETLTSGDLLLGNGTSAVTAGPAWNGSTLTGNVSGSAASFTGSLAGDVTGTQGATVIAPNVVTYAMMQTMTPNKLLGSGLTGTAVEEITLGTGLSFTGSTLNTVDNGTVTSIGMTVPAELEVAPASITTSGTFALSWGSEGSNTVFAGPKGSTSTPSFRYLVSPDIPAVLTLGVPGEAAGTLSLANALGNAADSTTFETSATTPTANYTYVLPAQTAAPPAGGVLAIASETGSSPNYTATLGWSTGSGLIVGMGGDVTGTSSASTVAKINGVALGSTTATSGNVLIGSGSQWVTEPISQDVSITNTGVATVSSAHGNFSVGGTLGVTGATTLSSTLGVTGLTTATGGISVPGTTGINNSSVANTVVASTTNIDATTGAEGVINIGNNGGTTAIDSSTTNIAGAVNFTGQVNIPAADLNLGLANDEFYIGNVSNIAVPQPISQDVSITNTGVATVSSAHGNFSVGGTLGVTSATTLSSTLGVTGLTTATGGISVPSTAGINNSTTANTVVASTTNIDATTGAEGVINIGNNGGTTAIDSSTTNIAGAVNFTGQVNIPAADLNLGLANDEFYIGNVSNIAVPQPISQDVSITNTGVATVSSAHGNFSVGGTLGVTSATTLSSTLGVTGLTTATGGISVPSTAGINNSTTANTVVASTTNIDATTGAEGVINIGNNGGTTAIDSSTTNIAGAVNFTGQVNIPAADLNLGLANDEFYIGSVGNIATPQTITQDVSITNGGVATVSSAHGNFSVGGTLGVTGLTTATGGISTPSTGGINNSSTINTVVASTTNIDATTGAEGVINIGNNGGTTAVDSSTTNIAGAVNFTGQVNIPAGDLNLGLANDKFYIGNSGGIATPQTISQDVTITNGGVATVNGSSATTFAVTNAETVGTTLGVTGLTTATGGISTPSTGGINNSSTINTVVASTTNIDATTGAEGVINIGNNGGTTAIDSSTTNIFGAVNMSGNVDFTGTVTLPAGTTVPDVGVTAQTSGTFYPTFVNTSSTNTSVALGVSGGMSFNAATDALTLGKPGSGGVTGSVVLDNSANAFTTTLEASTGATATAVYELPTAGGSANQVLETTGSSSPYQLQWGNAATISPSLTTNGAVYATSTSAIASTAQMTAGELLIGSGASSAPLIGTITTGTGISATYTSPNIVLTNTGVTSNAAGTGISLNNTTGAVTITNSGVTSNAAGTGISLNNTTGAVTITNTGVTSLSGGTTGLTDGTGTGAVTLTGTLVVANGGTGDASFTAYAPIVGGTTTTGQLQSASSGMSNSGYVLTSTGSSTLPTWQAIPASASAVLYNQTSLQNTATIAATNYLFDVGYVGTASTNAALGAQITSTNTAAGAGTAAQNSATGLTINATATGTNTTKQGTATGLYITISGDTSGPAIVLHNATTPATGDSVHNIIESSDNSLDIEQTGDLYGSSLIHMQNRTGANGAIFQTISSAKDTGTDLVDWGFIPGNGVQSNIRLEERHKWAVAPYGINEYLRSSANIAATAPEEFQYFFGTTGASPTYTLDVGENATMLERGNFGIGYGTNTAGDTAAGSPRERLDVHSPGAYYGAISGYSGASNIILSDSGTTTGTAPYIGALEFQGANDGLSSFEAGAQGSKYVTYTWPTLGVTPATGMVLEINGTVGGSGTLASPWTVPLQWETASSSSTGVNYDVTAAQATSTTLTDNLFDVAYHAETSGNAAGAVITSAAGTTGNNAATGLTLTTTANGSGAASGLVLNTSSGTGTAIDITTPSASPANGLVIQPGTASGTNIAGGSLTLQGGTSIGTGTGGALDLNGGAASATSGSPGGSVVITAGSGTSTSTGGAGGSVSITAGSATSTGNNNGGSVTIAATNHTGSGTDGTITIGGAAQTGSITLGSSTGANIVNVGTGAGTTTVNVATGGTGSVTETVNLGSTTGSSIVNLNGAITADINSGVGNASYSVSNTDYAVILDWTSGTRTLTLPSASVVGRILYVVNTGGTGGTSSIAYEAIAGATSTTIAAHTSYMFMSDGTNWYQLK